VKDLFSDLKPIDGVEQPELYEEVLIVNADKTDFNKAAYMCWNKGTADECWDWYDEHDQSYALDEWPFWSRFEG